MLGCMVVSAREARPKQQSSTFSQPSLASIEGYFITLMIENGVLYQVRCTDALMPLFHFFNCCMCKPTHGVLTKLPTHGMLLQTSLFEREGHLQDGVVAGDGGRGSDVLFASGDGGWRGSHHASIHLTAPPLDPRLHA